MWRFVPPKPHEETARRLKAARILCGYDSAQKLADALDEDGLRYRTIVNMEAGTARLSTQNAEYIARRLGLDPSFFSAPVATLGDTRPADQRAADEISRRPAPRLELGPDPAEGDGPDRLDLEIDRIADRAPRERPATGRAPGKRAGAQKR